MDEAYIIIDDGAQAGNWYIAVDDCEYINKSDFINISSKDIYIYSSHAGMDGSYILLKPYSLPEYYVNSGSNPVTVTGVTNVTFNWIGNIYHERPLINLFLIVSILIYLFVALLIKK